jgi:hypothetical protein
VNGALQKERTRMELKLSFPPDRREQIKKDKSHRSVAKAWLLHALDDIEELENRVRELEGEMLKIKEATTDELAYEIARDALEGDGDGKI